MIRCPNENYSGRTKKELSKTNQLGRKFKTIFDILMNPNYYEGTPQGRYFYRMNDDGTSKTYVKDPLEKELNELLSIKNNEIRYLVGFTGMGKTTLLRNFFHVFDRDIHVNNDQLILYISFYYASLSADEPYKSVENEVVRYLLRSISTIMSMNPEIFADEDLFWDGLYDYIEKHKPIILQNEELKPGISLKELYNNIHKSHKEKCDLLNRACDETRLEYYSCMLKYVLGIVGSINNIIFIFDDIESKEAIFHRPVVEIARHLHSCFSFVKDRSSWVKTIVSLRAYTFRSNLDRQMEARREQIEKNTILKREAVDLHDIFEIRFNEIESIEKEIEKKGNPDSYKAAKEQLKIVENQINLSFGKMIYYLANCNLCDAMLMYNSILINVEWITQNESESKGGFQVSAKSYRLTAKTVFHALACGNEITYLEKRNNCFPNLLHNKDIGTELMNLFIIRYMMRKGASKIYGEIYIQGDDIIRDITRTLVKPTDADVKRETCQSRIRESLRYLYNSGILLQSIYDIENLKHEQIEREYLETNKLYLSPRAQFLYGLLSQNALLLELYRDSIYTDIKQNDILTSEMKTKEVMQYLIEYVGELFFVEKGYIGNAIYNLEQYQAFFGEELLTAPLLEGIVKNIKSYYPNGGEEFEELMQNAKLLVQKMIDYIDGIKNEKGTEFAISNYLLLN